MLKKIDTGIFKFYDLNSATPEDIEQLQRKLSYALKLENWLSFYETAAAKDLANPHAAAVIASIEHVRAAVHDIPTHNAAMEGLHLGMFIVMMEASRHEKYAKSGRGIHRRDAEARDSEGLRAAKQRKREIHAKWFKCAAEYSQHHPAYSARDVAKHVASEFSTNSETVRRALRNFIPPEK
jgi:hypothetical protein